MAKLNREHLMSKSGGVHKTDVKGKSNEYDFQLNFYLSREQVNTSEEEDEFVLTFPINSWSASSCLTYLLETSEKGAIKFNPDNTLESPPEFLEIGKRLRTLGGLELMKHVLDILEKEGVGTLAQKENITYAFLTLWSNLFR